MKIARKQAIALDEEENRLAFCSAIKSIFPEIVQTDFIHRQTNDAQRSLDKLKKFILQMDSYKSKYLESLRDKDFRQDHNKYRDHTNDYRGSSNDRGDMNNTRNNGRDGIDLD